MLSILSAVLVAAPTTPPARVAVFVWPREVGSSGASARAEDALTRALEAEGLRVGGGQESLAENPGVEHLRAGREAFDDLDLEAAVQRCLAALEWFEENPAQASSKTLSQIHLLRASLALTEKGGGKRAQDEMEQALTHDPDAELDPKYFGPDARKVWEKAKNKVATREVVVMNLNLLPAVVTVRGTVVSEPVSLRRGRHLLLARRAGHHPGGLLLDVTRGRQLPQIPLTPTSEFAEVKPRLEAVMASGLGRASPPADAAAIGRALGVRFLVLGTWGPAGAQVEVWDTEASNSLRGLAFKDPDHVRPVALAVKNFIASPPPLRGSPPLAADLPGSTPLYKRWWVWAGVGGLIAGAAVVGVVATRPPARPFDVVLNLP